MAKTNNHHYFIKPSTQQVNRTTIASNF